MADRKPDRLVGDERSTLQLLFQYQRDSFVRKLTGISESDARREFVASGTTLLWLTKHLAQAEIVWFCGRFADDGTPVPDDTLTAGDTLAASIDFYRATWVRTDAIVAGASLDELCRAPGDGGAVNLRWVLMHLLEETARHAGHADILRELVDGQTGR